MGELQDFGETYNISKRHTVRLVQELEDYGWVKKAKLKDKRKRKGYIFNEDNIGTLSEMWFNFPKSKRSKKVTQEHWTQKMLSQYIDIMTKNYHDSLEIRPNESKKVKKMKQEWKQNFAWMQLHDMYYCITLISMIEWALSTGMLGSGKGKESLAERNISKLRGHIKEMSNDLKKHNKKIWKQVLGSVYNTLENNKKLMYSRL